MHNVPYVQILFMMESEYLFGFRCKFKSFASPSPVLKSYKTYLHIWSLNRNKNIINFNSEWIRGPIFLLRKLLITS